MKKLFVLIISALLCLTLIPSAFADVTLWDRLDNGDVVAKTSEPTEEEMSNLAPHEHTFGDWYVLEDSTCSEPGLIYQVCSGCGFWNVAKSNPGSAAQGNCKNCSGWKSAGVLPYLGRP